MLISTLVYGLSALFAADGSPTVYPNFQHLTNTRRSVTNFNVETIRGMAFDTTLPRLYAVNTHGSTLVFYDQTSVSKPVKIFPTLNNPSALYLWDEPSPGTGRFAIVVGGGTHGVVKQDRDTGDIVKYLALPSEPMDVVIDKELNRAYVSCAGAFDNAAGKSGGVVMRIDLGTFTFAGGTPAGSGQIFIDGARPTFLNIEHGSPTTTIDNFVFVTPFLSGNNTTHALNGFDEEVVSCSGLPDDDLFRIDPQGSVTSVVSGTPALAGAGTLLTNHARNPATGKYWMLNVESLNAARHTEPDHRGRFAQNRVTIVNATGSSGPFTSWAQVGLDQGTVPGQAAPLLLPGSPAGNGDKPVSFPFGLAFHDQPASNPSGLAFVVSSTGDILRMLDKNGVTLRNIELLAGSIPRGVLLSPDGLLVCVYAWGRNQIFVYDISALFFGTSAKPLKAFDLGIDPTAVTVKRGREIWYDADNSKDPVTGVVGTVSCNTCHPRGGMDMLGWDLGDPPLDRKDTMVTQSLIGIEDTFPYHWRGERTLAEFNGAFSGLLGGTDLGQPDLDAFQAFVFSLAPPANPRENVERVLDQNHVVRFQPATGPLIVGSALNGQTAFLSEPNSLITALPATCAQCHGAESGTNGVITQDIQSRLPSSGSLDVAHLRQLQHKFFQPLAGVTLPSGAQAARPRGGFGFSQDGSDNDILDFLGDVFFPVVGGRTLTQHDRLRTDTATFLLQFDQGIAPRAHTATLFDSATSSLALVQTLIGQASAGWLDVVAVGKRRPNSGAPFAPFAVFFDTAGQVFRTAETTTAGSQSFSAANLEADRVAGNLTLLVLGLPPGNGFRFAVDPDDDGASTLRESLFTFSGRVLDPQDADTDDDTFLDDYELSVPGLDPTLFHAPAQVAAADTVLPTMTVNTTEFVNGRISKHFVTFSEPVTYSVQPMREFPIGSGVFAAYGPAQSHNALCRSDTLVAQGLLPSIAVPNGTGTSTRNERFQLQVSLRDSAGRTNTQTFPNPASALATRPAVFAPSPLPGALKAPALEVVQLALANRTGNTFTFNVNLDDIWRGATPPLPANEGGKVVVLQLVTKSASGVFTPLPITSLTATGSTQVVPDFTIGNQPGLAALYFPGKTPGVPVPGVPNAVEGIMIPGPFILSPLTSGSGSTTVTVTVSPPPPVNTEAKLVMLGAHILATAQPPPAPQTDFAAPEGALYWQLPMTPAALRSANFTF